MRICRSLVATAAVLLLAGVALAAPTAKQTAETKSPTSSMTKTKTHHMWGVVDSVTDTDLAITHTYKGKTEHMTFKLDPDTKKVGTVEQGTRVEVYYKTENGEHVATEVKAAKSKMKM